MRQLFFILISAFLYADCYSQTLSAGTPTRQPYYLEKAPDAPGVYIKTAYKISGIPTADKTKTIQMIDAVVEAVKKAYPQPAGAHIGVYSGITVDYMGASEFKNGPYRVYITIPFYDLYKTASGGIEASGEYASSIEIRINNINYLLQANYVMYGNDRVYREPRPGIAVNGFPKYNNMVLITPTSKSLPWRPATKQEYLENYIEGLKINSGGSAEKQKIAAVEKLLADMSSTEKKEIAYLKKMKYSNAKNGFADFESYNKWAGFSNASDTTAEKLVIIDENFYNKTLPRSSSQVIVIERRSIYSLGIGINPDGTTKYDPNYKVHSKRMQSILMAPDFLNNLQKDLGRDQKYFAKTEIKPFALDPALVRRVNSLRPKPSKEILGKINLPYSKGIVAPKRNTKVDSFYSVIPARNDKALAIAGQRINNRNELVSYLDDLNKKISGSLKTNYGTEPVIPTEASPADISEGSVLAWGNGKPDQALLLSMTAAVKNPDNGSIVNNLAAMLNLCHIQYKSIPLSNYLLTKTPNNSTVLNNLGQAYLALGETQKAEEYLSRCVQKSPRHPEANNSLAYINDARRNKAKVIEYAENSLRGAFTVPAYNLLRKYKKDARLMDYVKHRYIRPEYFNPHKYELPKQCTNVETADSLRQVFAAYFNYLTRLYEKYNKLSHDEQKLAEVTLPQKVKENFKTHHNKFAPFNELGYNMMLDLADDYSDKMRSKEEQLKQLVYERDVLLKEYDEVIKKMNEKNAQIEEQWGEGNPGPEDFEEEVCKEKDAVGNLFLQRLAYLHDEIENSILPDFYQYMNDQLFWLHVACVETHQYKASFYSWVSSFFSTLLGLCYTTTRITPCSSPSTERYDVKVDMPEVKEPECPIDFSKEFFFGTISIDCDAIHFSAGEGVLANMDYEFATGAMTLAFGVGVDGSAKADVAELDFGTLSGGAEAGGSMKFFLSLDKNGHPTDGGFIWEAEAKLKEKFKSDFSSKSKSKSVGLDANVKLGINSGYTFSGSTFKTLDEVFGLPPEKAVNKNVKIYKAHN